MEKDLTKHKDLKSQVRPTFRELVKLDLPARHKIMEKMHFEIDHGQTEEWDNIDYSDSHLQ